MPQSVARFGARDTADGGLRRRGVCAVGLCRDRLDQGEDSLGVQSRDRDCVWPTLSDPLQDIGDVPYFIEYGGVDMVVEVERQLQKERRSVAGPQRIGSDACLSLRRLRKRRGYDSRNVDDREIRCVAQIGHAVVPSGDLVDRADRRRSAFRHDIDRRRPAKAQGHEVEHDRVVLGVYMDERVDVRPLSSPLGHGRFPERQESLRPLRFRHVATGL